jgi:hypothetical protein
MERQIKMLNDEYYIQLEKENQMIKELWNDSLELNKTLARRLGACKDLLTECKQLLEFLELNKPLQYKINDVLKGKK